jgi:hypothetical protein
MMDGRYNSNKRSFVAGYAARVLRRANRVRNQAGQPILVQRSFNKFE